MTNRGSNQPRRALVATAVGAIALLLSTGTAWASDQGNWDAVNCGDRGELCNWKTGYGGGWFNSSSERDSDYNNDHYGNQPLNPMGDQVTDYSNEFGTLFVRSYHQQDYVTGSTCLQPGFVVGPYQTGVSNGLSSFKSC